jgi:hypothetical protein
MNHKTSAFRLCIVLSATALIFVLVIPMQAQDTATTFNNAPPPDTWRGGYGNWSDPHKWTAGVPGTTALNQDVVVATSLDQSNWDTNTTIRSFTVGTGTSDSIVNGQPGHTMNILGPLIVRSGAFTLNQDMVAIAGDSTISGGGVLIGGVSRLQIDANVDCSSNLSMGGVNSQGDEAVVTGTWTHESNGSMQLGGQDVAIIGKLVNGGQVTLYCGATLQVTGDTNNTGCIATSANGFCYAGFTCIDTGGGGKRIVNAAGIPPDTVVGSTVNVNGTLTNTVSGGFSLSESDAANVGEFINQGTISIGTGHLTVGGFISEPGATFALTVAGPNDFGVTHASGSVALAGALQVGLYQFRPSNGETFKILLFPPGQLTGTFASVNAGWQVVYDNADGYVEVISRWPNVGS